MLYRRLASVLGVAALLVGCVIGTAGEAAAYPPINHCGSSYGSLKQYSITDVETGYGVGWIDTYYSSATGKNCAIARGRDDRASGFGAILIKIGLTGTSWWDDVDGAAGTYSQYAGPVYTYAPGKTCIDLYASLLHSGGHKAEAWVFGARC
ncbi:hypothetical protein [Kitasatospora sp. NPDC015120]|uniref:hypothetical protein n=1 Tax=Kitasatospora sp. NPDC015120 TaxID=3364023 RepID=UPI0036F4708B